MSVTKTENSFFWHISGKGELGIFIFYVQKYIFLEVLKNIPNLIIQENKDTFVFSFIIFFTQMKRL
jgi:hypothetical protein